MEKLTQIDATPEQIDEAISRGLYPIVAIADGAVKRFYLGSAAGRWWGQTHDEYVTQCEACGVNPETGKPEKIEWSITLRHPDK